jgi:FkbM family methyltransferase
MGLKKKVAKWVSPRPGPKSAGSDPYALLAYVLRRVEAPVVFDVGCNEGDSSAKLLRLMPRARVEAFEPSPATAARCRGRFEGDSRWRVHGMALGSEAGVMRLRTHAGGATDSLLAEGEAFGALTPAAWAASGGEVEVQVRRGDEVAAELGIGRIDLLKTDTQGFDDRVLRGFSGMLSRGAIGVVYAEMIFSALYEGQAAPHEIMRMMAEFGYRLAGLFDVHYEAGPVVAWCDGMFVHGSLVG